MQHKNKSSITFARKAISLCCGLFLFLSVPCLSKAQTIVPPVLADNPLGSLGAVKFINTAVIDYSPFCPSPGTCGNSQLMAVVASNGSNSNLYVSDGISPRLQFPLRTGNITPDVAIANSTTTPGNFLVGVTFMAGGGLPPIGNDIWLTVFEFTGVGGSLSLVTSTQYDLSVNGTEELFPHIDVIAEYNNTGSGFSGGLPLCDKFMITWTDITAGSAQLGSNIYFASMSNPTVPIGGLPLMFNDPTPTAPGTYNDIAAIERLNPGPSDDFMGLYVTHDAGGNLVYNEWNATTNSITLSTLLDAAVSDNIWPRIDAIDDVNLTPAIPYMVTAEYNSSIKVYNNGVGFGGLDISTTGLGSFHNLSPSVTSGLHGTYTVGHYTADGFNHMYAEDIDNSTGTPVGYPSIFYYQVNQHGGLPLPAPTSVSSSCNTQYVSGSNQYLFSCWANGPTIFYKLEPAMLFRPASVSQVNTLTPWQVYPNPVQDELTLTTSQDHLKNASYTISDITGRIILNGAITTLSQQVNMSNLSNGMYLVNLYNGSTNMKTEKIIKE